VTALPGIIMFIISPHLHSLMACLATHAVSLRLRHPTVYPIPQVRTKRYCSFKNYSLKH